MSAERVEFLLWLASPWVAISIAGLARWWSRKAWPTFIPRAVESAIFLFMICSMVRLRHWTAGYRLPWVALFAVAAIGGMYALKATCSCGGRPIGRLAFTALLATCITIAAAGCAEPLLFTPNVVHHYSFYVGPAVQVAQGASLLWDAPTQYGYLNIVALSLWLSDQPFENLLSLNRAAYLALTAIFFALWAPRIARQSRHALPTCGGLLLLSLVWAGAIFIGAGWRVGGESCLAYPSIGPLRFGPAILISALTSVTPLSCRRRALGWGVWLIGVFLSFESAVYVTAFWGPRLLGDVLVEPRGTTQPPGFLNCVNRPVSRGGLLKALSLAIVLVSASALLISCIEAFRTDGNLDWSCFWEYALAYHGGSGALPVNWLGTVWVPVIILIVLSMLLLDAISDRRPETGSLAGNYVLYWISLTYFVGRSHDVVIGNLASVHIACLLPFVMMVCSRRNHERSNLLPHLPRMIFAAYAAGIGLSHIDYAPRVAVSLAQAPCGVIYDSDVAQKKIAIEARHTGSIEDDGPMTFITGYMCHGGTSPTPPIYPLEMFGLLSTDRQKTFLDRYAARLRTRTLPSAAPMHVGVRIIGTAEEWRLLMRNEAVTQWLAHEFREPSTPGATGILTLKQYIPR